MQKVFINPFTNRGQMWYNNIVADLLTKQSRICFFFLREAA